MCRFLKLRQNGNYYFRRIIRPDLQPYFGQTAWDKSLKTKDREEAKRLVALETVRTDELIAAAEQALTPAQPRTAAQRRAEAHQREQEDRDDELSEMHMQDDWEREDRIASQEEIAKGVRTRLTGSTADMAPEDAVVARMLREGREAHEIEREDLLNEFAKLKASQESAGDVHGGDKPGQWSAGKLLSAAE